jgi:hypothetical protein
VKPDTGKQQVLKGEQLENQHSSLPYSLLSMPGSELTQARGRKTNTTSFSARQHCYRVGGQRQIKKQG